MYDLMYNRCLDEYYATVYVVCMYNRCLDDILFYCTLYVFIIDAQMIYYATVYVVCMCKAFCTMILYIEN